MLYDEICLSGWEYILEIILIVFYILKWNDIVVLFEENYLILVCFNWWKYFF